jgi:hypothetical protein
MCTKMFCANPVEPYCSDPDVPTTSTSTSTADDGVVDDTTTTTSLAVTTTVGTDAPVVCVDKPIDIAFVLDSSGSIGVSRFEEIKDEVSSIVSGLDIGPDMIKVSATTFSDNDDHTHTHSGFFLDDHDSESSVLDAIEHLPFHGSSTHTGTALEWTMDNVLSQRRGGDVPAVIIVITDGVPTGNAQEQLAASEAAAARE